MKSVMYQCPCCDYYTLDSRGDYDICKVCFWEDDGGDVDELDRHSGPNHLSLRVGRSNFLLFGACDKAALLHVVAVKKRLQFKHEMRRVN